MSVSLAIQCSMLLFMPSSHAFRLGQSVGALCILLIGIPLKVAACCNRCRGSGSLPRARIARILSPGLDNLDGRCAPKANSGGAGVSDIILGGVGIRSTRR